MKKIFGIFLFAMGVAVAAPKEIAPKEKSSKASQETKCLKRRFKVCRVKFVKLPP